MTTKQEQKTNAEILTPWHIAEEMIDKCFELGVLTQESKVCEPCCGKGVFVAILLLHNIKSITFSDINPANVQFVKLLTGIEGRCVNALTQDYTHYDLVITNPPYNSSQNLLLY